MAKTKDIIILGTGGNCLDIVDAMIALNEVGPWAARYYSKVALPLHVRLAGRRRRLLRLRASEGAGTSP